MNLKQNIGCEEGIVIAAFNNEDPGVLTVSNKLFTLPEEALEATFAQSKRVIDELREDLPTNIAAGTRQCLKTCGIRY